MSISFEPIALIHSCFKQKFGIPRQPGLVPELSAVMEILPPWNDHAEAFAELQGLSHIWVIFYFHAIKDLAAQKKTLTVRPPRLGGNDRVGVFASRSPYRPNPLGLSLVELEKIELAPHKILLHLRGGDFLDQTPVLDIKPYLAYADARGETRPGWWEKGGLIGETITEVQFTDEVRSQLGPQLCLLIEKLIRQDPRPPFTLDENFAFQIFDWDIHFKVKNSTALVEHIFALSSISR